MNQRCQDYFPNFETKEEIETEQPRKKRNTHIPHDIQGLSFDELLQFFTFPPDATARPVEAVESKELKDSNQLSQKIK